MKALFRSLVIAALASQVAFGIFAPQNAGAQSNPGVSRFGAVTANDCVAWNSNYQIKDAGTGPCTPLNSPAFTGNPTAPTQLTADNSTRLSTTAFVQANLALYALLNSPAFTGAPTAPTVTPGTDNSTKIATTAFVQSAIAAVSSGVTSFNSRSGVVLPASGDYSVAQVTGAAPLASPALTGTPTAPTAAPGTNTTQIASTAFVQAGLAAGVVSFNTRTGAVVPASGDYGVAQVTGAAPLASPTFTGTPAAPTPGTNINTTQIPTTAWVNSFYAPIASPTFTGTPITTTPSTADNTTKIASTAYVQSNLASYLTTALAASTYAPLASPALTGTPTAPTAATATNTPQLASTAFVQANRNAALPSATASQLYGGTAAAGTAAVVTVGTGLSLSGGTLSTSGGSAPVLLATLTASSSASLSDTTHITGTYNAYNLVFRNVLPATAGAFPQLTFSVNGGSSYLATGYQNANCAPTTYIGACGATGGGNAEWGGATAGGGITGTLFFSNPNAAIAYGASVSGNFGGFSNGGGSGYGGTITGGNSTASAVNAIKFAYSTGNIASGSILIYGIP